MADRCPNVVEVPREYGVGPARWVCVRAKGHRGDCLPFPYNLPAIGKQAIVFTAQHVPRFNTLPEGGRVVRHSVLRRLL